MEKLLVQQIKQVITQYPAIGRLLEAYGVGCTTCSVGTCLVKDIVAIHDLTKAQEQGLFAQMQEVLEGKTPDLTKVARAEKFVFIQPIQRMVDEHKVIKQLLKMIPDIVELILREQVVNIERIESVVRFIREYADTYHHAKEEGVLFSFVDQTQDIIQAMYHDHDTGRSYVRGMLDAAHKNDASGLIDNLIKYQRLLTGHIQKEDEILYPWIQRQLSNVQQKELTVRCLAIDADHVQLEEKYKKIILDLERETTGVV